MNNKKLALIIATLTLVTILLVGVIVCLLSKDDVAGESEDTVNSFEECVAAGYPVMESFPRQCRSEDGNLFVEEVTDYDYFYKRDGLGGTE